MALRLAVRIAAPLALAILVVSGTSGCGSGGKGGGAKSAQFSVTGSAPQGVDITYGSDGTNLQGPKHPPMNKTMNVNNDALYYQVTAQLQGGGNVTCKVKIGDAVKTGHARGGYNICSAQLNKDPIHGGWG
ncbi:MAG TPA: hypothetical protein VGJ58_04315 [Gaiellaceae bacterium]